MTRIEKLCVDKGLRMTEQRRIIARVLSDAADHPDAEELYRRASALDPHISIATVYRTVKLFEDAGILERHDFRDGLQWLDRRSRELFGSPFQSLDREKQTALLTRISNRKSLRPEDERGNRFFLDLRSRVVFAYYTSEAGLIGELAYKGKHVLGHWEGCPHPDHHGDAE